MLFLQVCYFFIIAQLRMYYAIQLLVINNNSNTTYFRAPTLVCFHSNDNIECTENKYSPSAWCNYYCSRHHYWTLLTQQGTRVYVHLLEFLVMTSWECVSNTDILVCVCVCMCLLVFKLTFVRTATNVSACQ